MELHVARYIYIYKIAFVVINYAWIYMNKMVRMPQQQPQHPLNTAVVLDVARQCFLNRRRARAAAASHSFQFLNVILIANFRDLTKSYK